MERKTFDISQYSFALSLLSPLEELRGPSFEQFNSSKDSLCQVWLKLAQYWTVFSLFWYYLTWKRVWPFICINLKLNNISNDLNALSLYISIWFLPWKMYGPTIELIWIPFKKGCFVASLSEIGPLLCGQLGWNWLCNSWEDWKTILFYQYYLKQSVVLHLIKLKPPSAHVSISYTSLINFEKYI